MNPKLHISTATFIKFWLVPFGIAITLLLLNKAQAGLIILGVSFFLALALNAPVSYIANKLPGKSRVGGTAIAYLAVIAFLSVVIFLVIPPIIQQTAQFAQRLPEVVQNATNQVSGIRSFVEQYNLQGQVDSALQSIQSSTGSLAGNVGQSIIGSIGSFFSFLAALILVLVLTFLMLVEGPDLMKRLWGLYKDPIKMEKHRRVAGQMYRVVSGYVVGQLTVSSIGATAAGLFVFVLSFIFPALPSNLAMPTAAITFVLSLIPMFGAAIGAVIIGILIVFNSVPAAIVYAIYFVIYQQLENNFISPHIQAKRINLSALMILGAITVGLYMFGLVGGIIAIPVAGSIRILIDEFLASRRDIREETLEAISEKKSAKIAAKKKRA